MNPLRRPLRPGRRLRDSLCLSLLVLLSAAPAAGQQAPDLTWTPVDSLNALLPPAVRVYTGEDPALPLRAWYVHIDEPDPAITTRVVVSDDPEDGREAATSLARDLGACVVVNGGYFRMDAVPAQHVGLLRIDGRTLAPPTDRVTRDGRSYPIARAALGLTDKGEVRVGWPILRGDSLLTLGEPLPNAPGTPAPPSAGGMPWAVRDALAAGPALLRDGQIQVTSDEEVFFGTSIPRVHPRTAAGRTADGALVLMVVDGRQATSRGASLEELAALMRSAGAVDALNLDGGGSSTLVVAGRRVNLPTGYAVEREVMSALATFCGNG